MSNETKRQNKSFLTNFSKKQDRVTYKYYAQCAGARKGDPFSPTIERRKAQTKGAAAESGAEASALRGGGSERIFCT